MQTHWTHTLLPVQFSHSVVSDSLRPHELQHTRPPCPSPTPGVHSNSLYLYPNKKSHIYFKSFKSITMVLEKTLESPLDCKEIQPVHPKGDQSWVFIGRTNAEAETPIVRPHLTHLKRHWCWERLRAEGEGEDRGWDGWMASPPQWTWVWVDSGSWWWTGRQGVLLFMGSQRVRHDWVTELNLISRANTNIAVFFLFH